MNKQRNQTQVMINQWQIIMDQPPPPPPNLMNQKFEMLSQSHLIQNHPPRMVNRSFGMWPPPLLPQVPLMDTLNQQQWKPRNWKGKRRGNQMRKGGRRMDRKVIGKTKRFYPPKKKFNRVAPYAPRNTTSYLIRAKKSGGIASLVSPCPVTPAILPTPNPSPSREVLGDIAKEEWGVDGYGSMKGLIRLRSPGNSEEEEEEEEEEEDGGSSSEGDLEEHVEMERRLDHDVSRFEMINPNYGMEYDNVLENRVDDQDSHISQLEEENLILRERLLLMERELGELRRRMQGLEEDIFNEQEVVEN